MCKFCDKITYTDIIQYNNEYENNEIFDTGGIVSVLCGIKGNMLSINSCENRWCYKSPSTIVKINFCPFCGKKLTDETYQKEIDKRELILIEKQLISLKYLTSFYGCAYRTQKYEGDINRLQDNATIFIPYFSESQACIFTYCSTNSCLDESQFIDLLPYSLSNKWDLQHTQPYSKDLFFNIDEKKFNNSLLGKERNTGMLIISNITDVEDLFDYKFTDKWQWNKDETLKKMNDFHNSVLNKIEELENRKIKIQKDNE